MDLPDLPDVHELARQDTEDGVQQQIVGAIVDHGGEILLLRRLPADFRGGAWSSRRARSSRART
ncbi:hypothetical protein ACFQ0O_18630 [Saccharopolyspora spinosporotrichia]